MKKPKCVDCACEAVTEIETTDGFRYFQCESCAADHGFIVYVEAAK